MKISNKEIEQMVSRILKEEIDLKSKALSEKIEDIEIEEIDETEEMEDNLYEYEIDEEDEESLMSNFDEQETEEGNAFSGALADAKKNHKDSFEVDGKKYQVKEAEDKKWIQKTDMKKGALRKKLGVPEGEKIPKSELKKLKSELMKKGEGDKKLSASDSKLLKQVNLALNLGNLKESKQSVRLTEDELIDMIENLVKEELGKVKDNIKKETPIGLKEVEKNNKKSKSDSEKNEKEVTEKIGKYHKDGSKEKFTTKPTHFPKGNGELGEMKKKAYKPSGAVEEYIANFSYPGQENLNYDEIKPNEKWLEDNLVGSSRTGNNPEWANAEKTDFGEKINKKRKENLYGKEKLRSYNRVTQPVDEAGEGEGEDTLDKMFNKLESTKDKKQKLVSEEINKMKNMINYNKKTQ